mmetsp:Transcript_17414/g.17141  ORF Transcript_17414/g.17141 Transcript_17414/m.17141 type:complete len:168 (-) Transcript_17414:205-708(-)
MCILYFEVSNSEIKEESKEIGNLKNKEETCINQMNFLLQEGLRYTIKLRKVNLKTAISGSIRYHSLKIPYHQQSLDDIHPWKLLERILYTLLYIIIKKSKLSEEILLHSFDLDENLGKFPQYKIGLQSVLSELEEEHKYSMDNYLFMSIQADCLKNKDLNLTSLINN